MKQTILATTSAVILAMAACSGPADEPGTDGTQTETGETADSGTTDPIADPAAPEGGAADMLHMIKLDCGSLYVSDLDIFSSEGDYAGETDTFTNPCWLIRHPEGDLIWDLGLPSILTSQDEQTTGVFTVSLERTIAEQLSEDHDIGMNDIEYLAISHSHFDHTGQVDLIDGSTWLVNQMEYDAMFPEPDVSDDEPDENADTEGGTDAGNQHPGFEVLDYEIIPDNHDVFGDGSVIIFMTPGHTPGHSSLLVNLPETGPVMLTGDLWHRAESRELGRVPAFNTDAQVTRESMQAFEARADELGARVIIQHEADDMEGLPTVMR